MNQLPLQEPEVKKHFKHLYIDYKLAITGTYFAGDTTNSTKQPFDWAGPHNIKATEQRPLSIFLGNNKTTTGDIGNINNGINTEREEGSTKVEEGQQ